MFKTADLRQALSRFLITLLALVAAESLALPVLSDSEIAEQSSNAPLQKAAEDMGALPAGSALSVGEREVVNEPPVAPRVKLLFQQAVQLLKVNRPFDAQAPFKQALVLAPRAPGIHCNLGLAYQNSGNIPKAIEEFQIALALCPHMPEATLNLAGCYQSAGENDQAIRLFYAYLEENPNSPEDKQIKDTIEALRTASQTRGDRSSADYLDSAIADGVYRWPRDKMPLRVFIQNGTWQGKPIEGYRASFRKALIDSFSDWCNAAGGRLSFKIVSTAKDANIVCGFTNNPSQLEGNGKLSERGSANLTARNGLIEHATVKILTRAILPGAPLSDDDVKKACLHEAGHALGLKGHSVNNHDVMFYTSDTATVWPVLSKRDKATIARLYQDYPLLHHPLLHHPLLHHPLLHHP